MTKHKNSNFCIVKKPKMVPRGAQSFSLLMAFSIFGLACGSNSSENLGKEIDILAQKIDSQKENVKEVASKAQALQEKRASYISRLNESFEQLAQQVALNAKNIALVNRWVDYLEGKPLDSSALLNGIETLKQLHLDTQKEEDVWNSYWILRLQNKEFEQQLQKARANLENAKSLYAILEKLRAVAYKAKETFDSLVQLEEQENIDKQRLSLLEEDLNAAKKNNWRVGKEIALYVFGLKFLWGIFTGYAASTSYGEQSRNLLDFKAQLRLKRNYRSAQKEVLNTQFKQQLQLLENSFEEESKVQESFAHKNGILELKSRILDAFEQKWNASQDFFGAEQLYREAIIAGLKEPLKAQVLESWSLGGFTFGAEATGGYKNEIGRVLPPFVLDGSIRPNASWEKRVQRKVGGGWRDELKSFRRANYEEALDKLSAADTNLANVFEQLNEFKPKEDIQPLVDPAPKQLFASIKFYLEVALREEAVIRQAFEEHERLIQQFYDENAQFLTNYTDAVNSKSDILKELDSIKGEIRDLILEGRRLQKTVRKQPLFFAALQEVRTHALKARDAFEKILVQEQKLEEAKEWLRLRKEDYEQVKQSNWRVAKEVVLHIFALKFLWGIFTGWAPTTSYAKEAKQLEEARENLEALKLKQVDLLRQLQTNFEVEVAKTLEALDKAKRNSPSPTFVVQLDSFELNFSKAFDELELARDRFNTAFDLYRKSMENGINSYNDFYNHEYADVVDLQKERSGFQKGQPSLAADWILLERERESEQFYKAKTKFFQETILFRELFSKGLEDAFSNISITLEDQRRELQDHKIKIVQLKKLAASLEKSLKGEVEEFSATSKMLEDKQLQEQTVLEIEKEAEADFDLFSDTPEPDFELLNPPISVTQTEEEPFVYLEESQEEEEEVEVVEEDTFEEETPQEEVKEEQEQEEEDFEQETEEEFATLKESDESESETRLEEEEAEAEESQEDEAEGESDTSEVSEDSEDLEEEEEEDEEENLEEEASEEEEEEEKK